MTANAMIEDRKICLKVEMDYFVSKPFKVEYQMTALKRCKRVFPGPSDLAERFV